MPRSRTFHNHALPVWQQHLLRWEGSCVPAAGEDVEAAYERCRATAFSDNAADPGGATMMGITLRIFRVWRSAFMLQRDEAPVAQLRAMTYFEWTQIVRHLYWDYYALHTVPFDCLALCIADGIFMSGRAGIRDMQRVLGCEADGIVGPKTIGAMRHRARSREYARELCARLVESRMTRLRRLPRYAQFGHGWENRANALLALVPTLDINLEGE